MSLSKEINASIDYYEVLQVKPTASREEIDRAFRRLVLIYHPDKNPDRREWSEQRIRELIRANEILGNEEKRRTFDQIRRLRRGPKTKRVSEPFFRRKRDPGARAYLILHLLLENKAAEARQVLAEEVARHGDGFLGDNLERRDYLDCLFLLAEHALDRKDYFEAFRRLRSFYRLDREARYPRHYRDEVHRLLKDVCLRKLPKALTPEGIVDLLAGVQDLDFTPQEDARRLELVAAAQIESGDREAALETLARLERTLPGTREADRVRALLAS